MPRAIAPPTRTRTPRPRLTTRRKPYWLWSRRAFRWAIAPGLGTWTFVLPTATGATGPKKFALADDHEDVKGEAVLDFWTAQGKRAIPARRGRRHRAVRRPSPKAIDSYRDDLIARGGNRCNATGAAQPHPVRPAGEAGRYHHRQGLAGRSATRCARRSRARL